MKVSAIALLALVLSGCAGQRPIAEMSYAEQQALIQELAKRCTEQGFGPDNPQHVDCVKHEAQREVATRQNNEIRRRQAGAAIALASQNVGNSMQQSAYANRPVTCTSTPYSSWVGGRVSSVTTNCY